jgi:hypothetical protein
MLPKRKQIGEGLLDELEIRRRLIEKMELS